MSLESKIKSKFKNASVKALPGDDDSIEVDFAKSRGSVVISKTSDEHCSASYPELVRDGRSGYIMEDGFSEDILIDGVYWILKKVKRFGLVKPEIMD